MTIIQEAVSTQGHKQQKLNELCSLEPRFGVGVSLPVSHPEIYQNWATEVCQNMVFSDQYDITI